MKSLADELAGAGAAPAPPQHGKRVSPLGPDETAPPTDEHEETDMPRKKRKATKTGTPSLHELREQVASEEAPKKRKYTRKAKASPVPVKRARAVADGVRFGVFSDGSVQIDAPSCKGNLSCEDVDLLYAFVSKLREVRK